ncbi:MAG: hypothetical protein ACLRMJ_02765 [Alistipes finegoldii]
MTVTYRPKRDIRGFRPADFRLRSSRTEPTAILSLRGAVTARCARRPSHAMGALRLKRRTVRFGRTDKVQSEYRVPERGRQTADPALRRGFAATG